VGFRGAARRAGRYVARWASAPGTGLASTTPRGAAEAPEGGGGMERMKRLVMVGLLCGAIVGLGRGAVAAGAAPATGGTRIDVNTASPEELEQLPGVGPALARAIVEHRTQAPFKRPEDLRDVKGIGYRLYEHLKDQITVGEAPKGRGQ